MGGILERYQRDQVKRKSKAFRLDDLEQIWLGASDAHKKMLLRGAFAKDLEPMPFGTYSEQEQYALRSVALFIEEAAMYQQAKRQKNRTLEARVNKSEE